MNTWTFGYRGFDPAGEKLREALCATGNGVFVTRGAAPESVAGEVHYPGTYRAGLYNRRSTTIEGETVENESLVNLPDWLPLVFRPEGGDWFDPGAAELLDYEQELDLRRGVLVRRIRYRDRDGRTTAIVERRFVSMADPRLGALETSITPLDWSGTLEIRSGLDGRVENGLVERYRRLEGRHLEPVEAREADGETLLLTMRTIQSRIRFSMALRTRFRRGEKPLAPERELERDDDRLAHRAGVEAVEGEPVTVEKVVAFHTSLDRAISETSIAARTAAGRAESFDDLLAAHVLTWDHLWRRCDVALEGYGDAERILRLYTYHLLQTVSPHTRDLDTGAPARGWHGEAYRGHVFWDELFVFPALVYRVPQAARSLLLYRHRRLDEARHAAREAGFEGAMYPWQSGSDGREESQRLHLNPRSGRWIPDHTWLQRHINVAIPYNVCQYIEVTGDEAFLASHGAEMILEAARFWSSAARYDPTRDRFVIEGVVGPDEFHVSYPDADEPGLDNNAYTNVMAVWVVCRAIDVLERLPDPRRREIEEAIGLRREEVERWEDVSRRMFVPFLDRGVLEQFEGYGELEELDWEAYRREYGDLQRLDRILEAEGKSPDRYQVSKQADVLMLLYLLSAEDLAELFDRLGYAWTPESIPRNIDHYLERTSHGSTLSGVVHSWVLARSDREGSLRFFDRSLESDVSDIQGGTTPEGIHLGAMAGAVDLVQRCFTGLEARGDALRFAPELPREIPRLAFTIQYRDVWMEIEIDHERLVVAALPGTGGEIAIVHREERATLAPGKTVEFRCRPASEEGR